MNTIEMLHEQRKVVERRINSLKEELGDIQAAIRAVEGRKITGSNGQSEKNGSEFSAVPAGQVSNGQNGSILASGMRPRAAAAS